MPHPISIVIIDSDNDSINDITRHVKRLGGQAAIDGAVNSFQSGFELIHKKRPAVAIINVCEDNVCDTEKITAVLSRFPQVTVFATCSDRSAETILKVMRAGATEYIPKPVSEEDITAALKKVSRLQVTREAPETDAGHIYTVFSPKGGVGATTIAVNLAASIYDVTKKPTILVDLDLDAGDVSTFLNLKPAYTLSDVALNINRLDENFMNVVIMKDGSGIHVLAEPDELDPERSLLGTGLRKILGILKTMFSYIVIDTESVIDERTTTAIEMSEIVLVPLVLSLPGIKNVRKHMNYFEKNGLKAKTRLVVNRFTKKGEIKSDDAERILKQPVFWSIPNDYEVAMTCLNKGVPFNVGAPRSQLNQSVFDMAKMITGKGEK